MYTGVRYATVVRCFSIECIGYTVQRVLSQVFFSQFEFCDDIVCITNIGSRYVMRHESACISSALDAYVCVCFRQFMLARLMLLCSIDALSNLWSPKTRSQ